MTPFRENGSSSSALSLVKELDSEIYSEGSVADEHSILCSKLANVIIKEGMEIIAPEASIDSFKDFFELIVLYCPSMSESFIK